MKRYTNPAIKQLTDQQVRYAPRSVRLDQINRAESLVHEIEPGRSYKYVDVCERITSYRPQQFPDLVLASDDLVQDLRLFVEDLSGSIDIPVEEAGEPVLTVDEVSQRFNVSTKTVDRWRKRGLVSRRFRFGRRKRLGFLKSSVDRFAQRHADEVTGGGNFSTVDDDEREEMIRWARRLARQGGCPKEVGQRLARRFNRSPETIRNTIKQHDAEQPHAAVFPLASSPLTPEHKKEIFRASRRGVPAERLARKYCRTKSSIYRIIAEVRTERLVGTLIDYMDSPEFHERASDETVFGEPPQVERSASRVKPPPGLPPYLASLYSIPLLTREEEAYYFRKMNYYKYKAAKIQKTLDPNRPRAGHMDRLEELLEGSTEVKNFLIRCNLRLVVSIAKRHVKPGANFFEMVSDGNMSLIRAIEKFDYTRGNKFSTYATWAIMKNFARSIPAEHTRHERFRTGIDEVFQHSTDQRSDQFQQELTNRRQHQAIMSILERLDDREKNIIMLRFGLEEGTEPLTLEQVGNRLGVTKERIRQLEARALKRARRIAQDNKLDIPGL